MRLKLLYALCLMALCLYVASGPAKATQLAPQIVSEWSYVASNVAVTDYARAGNVWVDSPTLIKLENVEVECGIDPCSEEIDFGFQGVNYPAQNHFTVTLAGYPSPGLTGTVSITWPVSRSTDLIVNDTDVSISPMQFDVTGSDWTVLGVLIVNLPAGGDFQLGESSLDFNIGAGAPDNAVPEPATAATLVAGAALVEFLRRKRNRQTH